MSEKIFDQIHIKLYEEIISGRFNPTHTRYANPDVLKGLVEEANTMRVALLPAGENPQNFIDANDFTLFGYITVTDFDLDIRPQNNGKQEIYIRPVKVYELKEMIDIPYFNSFKCTSFLELMGDEFERIKIRAEKILEMANDEKATRAYASKHVQKAKKMFHDAKRLLRELQAKDNPEDIYIIFALNLYIVRTILFYQKMFKPYLKHEPDTEEKLIHEVLKELSLKKLCSLFPSDKSSYCNYVKKSYIEKSSNTESVVQEAQTEQEKDSEAKKSIQAGQGKWPYSPGRWSGQVNALVDVFIQLTEEIKISGRPVFEMHDEDLLNFILTNFRDKQGKELSFYTLRTLLDKTRADKRLHPQSPKRIDVGRNINPKK
jgi:hypothetical protein